MLPLKIPVPMWQYINISIACIMIMSYANAKTMHNSIEIKIVTNYSQFKVRRYINNHTGVRSHEAVGAATSAAAA